MGIKKYKLPYVALSAFLLTLGVFYFLVRLLSYTFVPSCGPVQYTITTAIIIFLTVKGVGYRNEKTRTSVVLSVLLPLITIIFIVLRFAGTDTNGVNNYIAILFALIILMCVMILFFSCGCGKGVKIGFGVSYLALLVPIFFAFLIMILFGNFGSYTVVKSEISPNSVYLAEIIANDQGALGGSTKVYVTRQNRVMSFFIGEFKKRFTWTDGASLRV
jgi:hypothetical protein